MTEKGINEMNSVNTALNNKTDSISEETTKALENIPSLIAREVAKSLSTAIKEMDERRGNQTEKINEDLIVDQELFNESMHEENPTSSNSNQNNAYSNQNNAANNAVRIDKTSANDNDSNYTYLNRDDESYKKFFRSRQQI